MTKAELELVKITLKKNGNTLIQLKHNLLSGEK